MEKLALLMCLRAEVNRGIFFFSCTNLHYLSLRNCEHLTDLAIECIANMQSLISIDLSGTSISHEVNKKYK